MTEHYEAIVIGAGQAGPSLAARLGQEGLKTSIIERHLLGGACVNTGCIPPRRWSRVPGWPTSRGVLPSTA